MIKGSAWQQNQPECQQQARRASDVQNRTCQALALMSIQKTPCMDVRENKRKEASEMLHGSPGQQM